MSDLALRPACELADMLRRREISSVELLDHFLERVERLNPRLNAVVTLCADRAHKGAERADTAVPGGEEVGRLHGLPVTIKDCFELAGVRTTAGAPQHADHVPETSATAVRRLEAAGAIPFGKTNVPLFAGDIQSYNAIFGVTHNPWNTARSPGGSSGGAAAAVATGLTAFELGSDIGGSIRHPSHWCGVYGHKPSWGIVPQQGHIPPEPGARRETDLNVVGPIARSARDLALLLDVLAGPPRGPRQAWRLNLRDPRRSRLADYKVAAWFDDPASPVDAPVRARLEATVSALRAAGVEVDSEARPAFDLAEARTNYDRLLMPIVGADLPNAVLDSLAASDDPGDRGMAASVRVTHRDWLVADEARHAFAAAYHALFEDFDVLLMPVNPVAAIPHDNERPMGERTVRINGEDRPYLELITWVSSVTMCKLCATIAPIGNTPEGLPVGIQIVGRPLDDRTTIDFAERLADVIGGYEPPPGV